MSANLDPEVAALIQNVFDKTLKEYQAWSSKVFRRSIRSIERSSRAQDRMDLSTDHNTSSPPFQIDPSPGHHLRVEIVDIDAEGTISSPNYAPLLITRPIGEKTALEPHPAYESVTPVERSIFYPAEPSALPFVPFSDEPSFSRKHIHRLIDTYYLSLGWETMDSPEVDLLVLETARRLREHNLSIVEIDEYEVLPRRLRDLSQNHLNRDMPNCFHHKTNLRPQMPSSDIDGIAEIFCDNANCNVVMCSSHDPDWLGKLPLPRAPTIKNYDLKGYKRPHEPCDDLCYSLRENSGTPRPEWPASDVELFKTILEREPDAEPCDLATVMLKPCREVFAQRKIHLPDPPTTGLSPRKQRMLRQVNAHGHIKGEVSALVNGDWENPYRPDMDFVTVASEFTALQPCHHVGICQPNICECAKREVRCEKRCRCDLNCVRRHRGCECGPLTGKACKTPACACFHERRECDPDLCKKCDAGKLVMVTDSKNHHMICCNSRLQLKPNALRRKFEVRTAQYGLGLFTTHPIKSGELVTEYTGEIIEEDTVELRIFLSRYRKRNYIMQLAKDTELDAGPAGSVARYINHGEHGRSNVEAEVYLVNGEHRICLFATRHINAGEELLLNYGEGYFSDVYSRVSAARRGQGVINSSSASFAFRGD